MLIGLEKIKKDNVLLFSLIPNGEKSLNKFIQ